MRSQFIGENFFHYLVYILPKIRGGGRGILVAQWRIEVLHGIHVAWQEQ